MHIHASTSCSIFTCAWLCTCIYFFRTSPYNFMYVCCVYMMCIMHAMYIVCMHKHISLYIMHAGTCMNYIRVYVYTLVGLCTNIVCMHVLMYVYPCMPKYNLHKRCRCVSYACVCVCVYKEQFSTLKDSDYTHACWR